MLVDITYRHNPDYDPIMDNCKILKEVHYYISNEKKHDTLFVQHAFMLHWEFFKSKGYQPKQHVVWSDGYLSPFKSAKAWYFLARYHNLIVSDQLPCRCQMLWNYFAIRHGKGEVDGTSVLLKREFHKEQIKPDGMKIKNASEAINFLKTEANKFHVMNANA